MKTSLSTIQLRGYFFFSTSLHQPNLQNFISLLHLSVLQHLSVILSDLFLHRCLSLCYFISWNYHGTIIRTGITCKKILCYRCDSACRWFIFEFSLVWRNVVSWLVYANKLIWIVQPYSSTDITKRS